MGTDDGPDRVRREIMHRFGYYVTESSEHNAEYCPWFIKSKYPELIDRYEIPLDEYPRRCEHQIREWKTRRESLVNNAQLTHKRSQEYASMIMEAMVTNKPIKIGGNVLNNGCITNLRITPVLKPRALWTPRHPADICRRAATVRAEYDKCECPALDN